MNGLKHARHRKRWSAGLIASRIPPGQGSRKMWENCCPTCVGNSFPEVWKTHVVGPPGGTNFTPRGVPNGLPEASWGPLGRQVGHRRALWAEKGESEILNKITCRARGRPLRKKSIDVSPPGAPGGRFWILFGSPWGCFFTSVWPFL